MENREVKLIKLAGGRIRSYDIFEKIISPENLFSAWKEFKRGKTKKSDVLQFEYNLEDNIFSLYDELKTKTYQHSNYTSFFIRDPKLRKIHKATVKDRVLHRAIFRILYPIFDRQFIFDSYSCRNEKGTHKAVSRFRKFALKISQNNVKTVWILKCDVRKFFDSINQEILMNLISRKIKDCGAVWLLREIIKSFPLGIPLGNITSQLFSNIYLNEFDQFIKHRINIKYYIRYCDDFAIMSDSKSYLIELLFQIRNFLKDDLKLLLHSGKIKIERYHQGIDFLGYVCFPFHKILRTATKHRMFTKINKKNFTSYNGMLSHCRAEKIKAVLTKIIKHQ